MLFAVLPKGTGRTTFFIWGKKVKGPVGPFKYYVEVLLLYFSKIRISLRYLSGDIPYFALKTL